MCRIAGIISNRISADEQCVEVRKMCHVMQHGGPDDEGFFSDDSGRFCLGHRRLSLIDLSAAGHQPMSDLQRDIWIVFNGEIYNFKEIRRDLEGFGYTFRSHSDTEVIIIAYKHWGVSAFKRFNGMFAFCLADLRCNEIFLVRDSAGIKPLYYGIKEGGLYFSSEVRAFRDLTGGWEENPDWRFIFQCFGHIPEPYTTLKDVYELEKGHFLKWSLQTQQYSTHTFQELEFESNGITDSKAAKELIRETLKAAVTRHLIADAPLGVFLSGGIDSSLVAILAAQSNKEQLHTLSVVFNDEKYSEKKYQEIVIDKIKCKHTFYKVEQVDFDANLSQLINAYDQPSNDGINSWYISKCAHENGLKAVLSGLGADELFGGYPSFKRIGYLSKAAILPNFLLSKFKYADSVPLQRLQWLKLDGALGLYLSLRGISTPQEIAQVYHLSVSEVFSKLNNIKLRSFQESLDTRTTANWLEFNLYMQNQLLKDSDYMSMQHALELRVPFLDQDLIKAVYQIDPTLLYGHQGLPKQFLIDAFKDILPEPVWNRQKMGFTFPFQQWLLNNKEIDMTLRSSPYGRSLWDNFREGKIHWSKVWTSYVAQRF